MTNLRNCGKIIISGGIRNESTALINSYRLLWTERDSRKAGLRDRLLSLQKIGEGSQAEGGTTKPASLGE